MRSSRRIRAFVSGLLLYGSALGLAVLLSALPWPNAITGALGGSGSFGALLAQAGLTACLLFGLALCWAYLSLRRQGRRATTAWCVGGLGLAWFIGLLFGVFQLSMDAANYQPSIGSVLLSATVPPLWGVLNVLALLAGILMAGRLANRDRSGSSSSGGH